MAKTIPAHLYRSQYWRPVLHLFTNHYKLKSVFTSKYFDLDKETIKVNALKRLSNGTETSASWSSSEKLMLKVALHCWNDSNKVDLGGMDFLDDNNRKLVLEALTMRYGGR